MALRAGDLPVGNWIYELKFDGYRSLAFKVENEVRLVSRNRTNFDNDYPQLVDALKSLTAKEATIDGEIAALDQHGKSSFQLLQSYGKAKQTPPVGYILHDPNFSSALLELSNRFRQGSMELRRMSCIVAFPSCN